MNTTEHAARQARTRGIDAREVAAIVRERCGDAAERGSWAVLVGFTDEGWRGASNGDVVWAIVRDGTLATVMFRRRSQPSTPEALRVERVVA